MKKAKYKTLAGAKRAADRVHLSAGSCYRAVYLTSTGYFYFIVRHELPLRPQEEYSIEITHRIVIPRVLNTDWKPAIIPLNFINRNFKNDELRRRVHKALDPE